MPFENDSIKEILIYHTLEHIQNFVPLMHELYRISEPGAIIKIKVPFYSAWGQFNDPTHVRFFTPFSFDYFKPNNYSHEVKAKKEMFKMKEVKINFGIGVSSKMNKIINPILNLSHKVYCRFFAWIFPAAEIYYELEILK